MRGDNADSRFDIYPFRTDHQKQSEEQQYMADGEDQQSFALQLQTYSGRLGSLSE
jgi:hypothetical protein